MPFREVPSGYERPPVHRDEGAGDVLHGQGYRPQRDPDDLDAEAVRELLRHECSNHDQQGADQHRKAEQRQRWALRQSDASGDLGERRHLQHPDEEVGESEDRGPEEPTRRVHERLRHRQGEQEHTDHGGEPDQRDDPVVGANQVAEEGEARPAPPEQTQHHQATQERRRVQVFRGQRGDVQECEDEDQVIEELQPGAPGTGSARSHPPPPTLTDHTGSLPVARRAGAPSTKIAGMATGRSSSPRAAVSPRPSTPAPRAPACLRRPGTAPELPGGSGWRGRGGRTRRRCPPR